jgi:hypothetical protein
MNDAAPLILSLGSTPRASRGSPRCGASTSRRTSTELRRTYTLFPTCRCEEEAAVIATLATACAGRGRGGAGDGAHAARRGWRYG